MSEFFGNNSSVVFPSWAKALLIEDSLVAATLRSWLLKFSDGAVLAQIDKKVTDHCCKKSEKFYNSKIVEGYSTFVKYKPHAGTENPAFERVLLLIT